MSCQSLATRAFTDTDDKMTHCNTTTFQRSVRFSSESRSSTRNSNDAAKKESSGCMSMSTLTPTPMSSTPPAMSQSAPPASTTFDLDETPSPPSACRFPKLEECAHFHYERVALGGLRVDTLPADTPAPADGEGWICLKVRSHVNQSPEECEARALNASWSEASEVSEWTLSRNRENLLRLDDMLHRCIYDRKVSGLPDLSEGLAPALGEAAYRRLIADYMHHLSIIADDSINCGPVLNWLQMDNKGHKLLVANEDSSSINTPAVAAAYSVRKYVSQARDEISFEVGDMISIIDMPGPNESQWWRGKRGFRVGFFPHQCVAVIGDKVPRNMTQPPPIVGSVAVAPIKPVLRKHGKLISLFRSFILSRPSRRSLKQQGILRERVFGCDLGEHLLNSGYDVPLVLVECARVIESRGAVDGVYRLSGGSGLTQRLRAAIDAGHALPAAPDLARDPHAVPSLLKMYFRELPNPLCTYQLYESFVSAMQEPDEGNKLRAVRQTVVKLPPPHYRTLSYLMRHLRRVSLLGAVTGMTPRNMAIVWAPNLLRAPRPHHALQGVAVQAVVTEFLICYAEELFSQEQGADSGPESIEQESDSQVELRGSDTSGRRPKSLPVNPPTKLLSLEEARRRGGGSSGAAPALPVCGTIAAAAADTTQLRPSASHKPKYIEVGSGPDNLPQYHTVLELPLNGHKRGVKRSPSGWRGLFSRSKHRARTQPPPTPPPAPPADEAMSSPAAALRPVKSCESLASDSDTLPPLARRPPAALKQHTRSSSVDSYFEPWVSELAAMRLRLAPQERDHHMFSEEDDTQLVQGDSLCSTPPESGLCSVEPSPRRNLHVDIEAAAELAQSRLVLDTAAASLRFIDGESPRAPPEKRHSNRPPSPHHTDIAKRLCKDRNSKGPLVTDFPVASASVKLRERHSPKKSKNRYSGLHTNELIDKPSLCRLSWPNKDGHSTLIKIDWPIENSVSNLTTSTLNSSPVTPVTPAYDQLETDSEISDSNKHTIKINSTDCLNCNEGTCLKCELKAADYENVSPEASLVASEISYQNLNRLSAVSSSSDDKKDVKVMTSSHESSSTYSNSHDDYECYNFSRPSYINLNTSSSKSSPSSPLKSPLKSTISITFKPSIKDDSDSLYEDVNVDKSLSIVEDASIPQTDASLPTQNACQPDFNNDLIILESPIDNAEVIDPDTIDSEDIYNKENNTDVYSQVKFLKKSIEEVNAMILELPENQSVDMPYQPNASGDIFEKPQSDVCFDSQIKSNLERHYENINFDSNDYANINVDTLNLCDKLEIKEELPENGNIVKEKNLNVRELAIRFESPTEAKGTFTFEKFKTEIKYPSLERKDNATTVEVKDDPNSPKSYKLTKNSTRSLDESAFIKEFGPNSDRRKSFEVKKPDLNLNLNLNTSTDHKQEITPTTENKISLIQRFNDKPVDIKQILNFDTEKKLSRERIEKYKEERRLFLREKYSSQSFRSNPEQLTRIKIKKEKEEDKPFERRNTVDLGQRMRFSLAKSANNLDIIQSPAQTECDVDDGRFYERKEKTSPSYNIKDMTALFEQKNQNGTS